MPVVGNFREKQDIDFLHIGSQQIMKRNCHTSWSKNLLLNKGTVVRQIESCVNLLASRKVTSRSSSRSFLLPTRRMTMAGLARVRASVSQLARLLKDSRELTSYTRRAPEQTNYMLFGTDSDPEGNRIRIQYGSGTLCQAGKGGI